MIDSPERALVIFLAAALAILLGLAIFVLVRVLQVVNKVRSISSKIDSITDKADVVANIMSKASPAAAFGGLISFLASKVRDSDNDKKEQTEDEKKS